MDVSENGSNGEFWRRGDKGMKTSPFVIFVGSVLKFQQRLCVICLHAGVAEKSSLKLLE